MTRGVAHVAVVVPAHDEEELLPACLDALRRAADRLQAVSPATTVEIVVVLDQCTDGSAGIVARAADVRGLEIHERCVGAARSAGTREVLGRPRAPRPDRVWVANTDADSEVPENWLSHQVRLAGSGADAVIGTVAVGRSEWGVRGERVRALWVAGYDDREGHPHVHGANLGVRGSALLRAGGFPAVTSGEDEALVAALAATTAPDAIVRTAAIPVLTSARRDARCTSGFAGFLDDLEAG
jgi:glycosyltransferase involved in cell wall biosynthesis